MTCLLSMIFLLVWVGLWWAVLSAGGEKKCDTSGYIKKWLFASETICKFL